MERGVFVKKKRSKVFVLFSSRGWTLIDRVQVLGFRVKQYGNIFDGLISTNPLTVNLVSDQVLFTGRFGKEAKLRRSIIYFSKHFDKTARIVLAKFDDSKDKLYIGLSDGSFYSKSKVFPSKLSIKVEEWDRFCPISLPVYDIIPLRRLNLPTTIAVLYKRNHLPETILSIWRESKIVNSIHSLKKIDCFATFKDDIFWISDYCIKRNERDILEHIESNITPLALVCISNLILLIEADNLVVYDAISLVRLRTVNLPHKADCVFTHNLEDDSAILLIHNRDSLELSILLCQMEEGSTNGKEIKVTNQKPSHWRGYEIQDVYFDNFKFVLFGGNFLSIYNMGNLNLIGDHKIPLKILQKHKGQKNFDSYSSSSKILHVLDQGNMILTKKGQSIFLWKFDAEPLILQSQTGSSSPANLKKTMKAQMRLDAASELEDYRQDKLLQAHLERKRHQFNLENMTESELIEYARILSISRIQEQCDQKDEDMDSDLERAIKNSIEDF